MECFASTSARILTGGVSFLARSWTGIYAGRTCRLYQGWGSIIRAYATQEPKKGEFSLGTLKSVGMRYPIFTAFASAFFAVLSELITWSSESVSVTHIPLYFPNTSVSCTFFIPFIYSKEAVICQIWSYCCPGSPYQTSHFLDANHSKNAPNILIHIYI